MSYRSEMVNESGRIIQDGTEYVKAIEIPFAEADRCMNDFCKGTATVMIERYTPKKVYSFGTKRARIDTSQYCERHFNESREHLLTV